MVWPCVIHFRPAPLDTRIPATAATLLPLTRYGEYPYNIVRVRIMTVHYNGRKMAEET
jgi:hypothetical protein